MGTVTRAATAVHALDLGADFVFAPSLSPDIAAVCHQRNGPYAPGSAPGTSDAPAVGMGSNLLTKDLISSGDWDGLERQVAATVQAVAAARSKE